MTVSGRHTAAEMGNLSFWCPPDDGFRVFHPPLVGILPFWDPQMTVSGCFTPPPRWEICHSDVPQMAASGCFTPPLILSVILGSPDDSF